MVLPALTRAVGAPADGLRVYVSRAAVYLGAERQRVADLASDDRNAGYAASYKKHPNDLLVVPLLEALRSRQEPRQADVLLFADETTPYRVLLETLFTLTQGEYPRRFVVSRGASPTEVVGPCVLTRNRAWHDAVA